MNNIIELLPTKLIGVLVPKDSKDFKIEFEVDSNWLHFLDITQVYPNYVGTSICLNTENNLKIIGTTTSDYKFDFDCKKYLNKVGKRFFEYLKPGMMTVSSMNHNFPFENSKDSFISLLKANNVQIQSNQKLLILEKL